jgi:hypothetical protein
MDASTGGRKAKSLLDVIVGVEVGVIGGLVTLAWFALLSPIIGDPWWLIPNLFASYFYPEQQVRAGAGIITLVGSAVHLILSGLLGMINGVFTPGGRLFGLALAIVYYAVCYFFLWKRVAPLVLLYSPQPILMLAWFLLGSTLGWHPWFVAHNGAMEPSTDQVS